MRQKSAPTKEPADQVINGLAVRPGGTFRRKTRSGSCWRVCGVRRVLQSFAAARGLSRTSITALAEMGGSWAAWDSRILFLMIHSYRRSRSRMTGLRGGGPSVTTRGGVSQPCEKSLMPPSPRRLPQGVQSGLPVCNADPRARPSCAIAAASVLAVPRNRTEPA